jgi:hypothetical protein
MSQDEITNALESAHTSHALPRPRDDDHSDVDDVARQLMDDLGMNMTMLKNSSIFSGDEERFAFSRALSRLSEMGSREWVERGLGMEHRGGMSEKVSPRPWWSVLWLGWFANGRLGGLGEGSESVEGGQHVKDARAEVWNGEPRHDGLLGTICCRRFNDRRGGGGGLLVETVKWIHDNLLTALGARVLDGRVHIRYMIWSVTAWCHGSPRHTVEAYIFESTLLFVIPYVPYPFLSATLDRHNTATL